MQLAFSDLYYSQVYPVFSPLFQVNLEFMRITTVPLISKFFGQLDRYIDDLIKVFRAKGGSAGQKIRAIMALTAKVSVFLSFLIFLSLCPCSLSAPFFFLKS